MSHSKVDVRHEGRFHDYHIVKEWALVIAAQVIIYNGIYIVFVRNFGRSTQSYVYLMFCMLRAD